jgi:hypothetical protein
VIAYRATLDVPRELVQFTAKLLLAERRRRGRGGDAGGGGGTVSLILWKVLAGIYDDLGLDCLGDGTFRALVLAG